MKKTSVKYKSAVNVTLPAAAARAPARCSNRSIVGTRRQQLSIDICCLRPGYGKRQISIDGTDRRTDGRTSDRYKDPAPHTILAVSINKSQVLLQRDPCNALRRGLRVIHKG